MLADVAKAPPALQAVRRIDGIFAIEREINGASAELRRAVRQQRSRPLVAGFEAWMRAKRARLSRHNEVARAIDSRLKRWAAFARFLDDGRICLAHTAAERALRRIADHPASRLASSVNLTPHGPPQMGTAHRPDDRDQAQPRLHRPS